MSDFCAQCSIENFGEAFGDLKGLNPSGNCKVLCEGCGPTIVNAGGECIHPDCIKKHGQERW